MEHTQIFSGAPAAGRSAAAPLLSVVMFCSRNEDRPLEVVGELQSWLASSGLDHELVIALDADRAEFAGPIQQQLAGRDGRSRLVVLSARQGQLATIRAGVAVSTGRFVVTVPAFPQVEPSAIGIVLARLQEGADYVVGYRESRRVSLFNRAVSRLLYRMVRYASGRGFKDIACGAHGMRRELLQSIPSYGDHQLFLPILAEREGFAVVETPLAEHRTAPQLRVFSPGIYLARVSSLLTLAFLIRFTQKPLRPFGALGALMFLAGTAVSLVLLFQRFFMGRDLADRPMLLLGLLLVTAGIQVIILGLLGELLIYLHSRDQVQYRVSERAGWPGDRAA